MRKVLLLSVAALLTMGSVGCGGKPTPEATPTPVPEIAPVLEGKKVLMIIAHRDFRDEEYERPRQILEARGAMVTVASSSLEVAKGMLGAKVKPDILLENVEVEDYDAIIFIGGVGATEYWDDPTAHAIARKAVERSKVLAAICIAPVTLAKAGVLEGRRATAFSSAVKELEAGGAACTGAEVERDGLLITATGPDAAAKFGEEIARTLGAGD